MSGGGAGMGEGLFVEDADVLFDRGGIAHRKLLSQRPLGVGAGVFVIVFFAIFCALVCLLGSFSKKPSATYSGSFALFALICIILLLSPRKDPDKVDVEEHYDYTIISRVILGIVFGLGVVCSGLFMLLTHYATPHFAKPLTFADVIKE